MTAGGLCGPAAIVVDTLAQLHTGCADHPGTLCARDLSHCGWHLDPAQPQAAKGVVAGHQVGAPDIATLGVTNAVVHEAQVYWIEPADRAYAAAEMTATLTAWRAGLVEAAPWNADSHAAPAPTAALGPLDRPRAGRPLLLGRVGDTSWEHVRDSLYARGCAPIVLDNASLASLDHDPTAARRLENALADVASAYLRPDAQAGPTARRIMAWAQATPGVVINRPGAMSINASKPLQLALIHALGNDIPATLVTTDPKAAREFRAAHGDVVYKSVSGVRSIATALGPDDDLADVGSCPTMFQAYVPGVDVRVHVVGRRTFACTIEADRLDYRYAASVRMRPVALPAAVAAAVVDTVGRMGLQVAGADLRHRLDGGWTWLEVNPSPAFTFFTEHTQQPIAAAIAALLAQPAP
jgi:glutathione synthase/RimK-type ligase-like ATP-grasp enzyme